MMLNTNAIQQTLHTGIMKISDCCTSIVGLLPNPHIPFVPAFVLGICVSCMVLIYLVQKETKKPFSSVVPLFFHQLFLKFPQVNKKQDLATQQELKEKITLRWKNKKSHNYSERLKYSMGIYINSESKKINKENNGKHKQKSEIFHLEKLPSFPWWNQYEVHAGEQKILKGNFTKIKEEFDKVFADFQKGICKQWCKVELLKGHSCEYPLITKGVINTANCIACPTTFTVLSECRVMGLTGCLFGSAAFTLLYPDSSMDLATGHTNIRIKCDMVLQTTTKGHLEVDGTQKLWQAGEVLLYDDSFPHSRVLANSLSMDVVATPLVLLSLDLWHPGVDRDERTALTHLFVE